MTTENWTSRSFSNLANASSWSEGVAPTAGDTLIMRHGSGYLWGQNFSPVIYLGATDGQNPYIWMGNSSINVNMGTAPGDGPNAMYLDRSATIDAWGNDSISMQDTGYRAGGNGHLTVTAEQGSHVALSGSIGWMSTLSVAGHGQVTNENLDLTYAGHVAIQADMLGLGRMNFHGFTDTEISGAVGDGQIFTFGGSRNALTVDDVRGFHGELNFVGADAAGDSVRLMLPGADVTHADFSMGSFHLGGSDGSHETFKGGVPAAGADIWHVAGGVVIGAKPADATSDAPMWHAVPTTT